MGLLALGLFFLLIGVGLTLFPIGPLGLLLWWAGWICIAVGAILAVVHVAVGPRRVRGGRGI